MVPILLMRIWRPERLWLVPRHTINKCGFSWWAGHLIPSFNVSSGLEISKLKNILKVFSFSPPSKTWTGSPPASCKTALQKEEAHWGKPCKSSSLRNFFLLVGVVLVSPCNCHLFLQCLVWALHLVEWIPSFTRQLFFFLILHCSIVN